jgi:hypothetical protein
LGSILLGESLHLKRNFCPFSETGTRRPVPERFGPPEMQINGFAFSLLFFSDCGHAQVDYPSRVTHPGEGGGIFLSLSWVRFPSMHDGSWFRAGQSSFKFNFSAYALISFLPVADVPNLTACNYMYL